MPVETAKHVLAQGSGARPYSLSALGGQLFLLPLNFLTSGFHSTGIVSADFNGDGKLDLAVGNACQDSAAPCDANGSISIFLGNGDGTFQPAVNYDTQTGGSNYLVAADLNGDGKIDLIASDGCTDTNCDAAVSIFYGNGDGTFQAPQVYPTGNLNSEAIPVGDFNGDGLTDFVVLNAHGLLPSGQPSCGSAFTIFLNQGNGAFASLNEANNAMCGEAYYQTTVGDFNRDGKLDIAVSGIDATGTQTIARIWLGNGDGTFSAGGSYGETNYGPGGITAADFNKDGIPDLALTNYSSDASGASDGSVWVLLGNGDGTFTSGQTYRVGQGVQRVAATDLNSDGNTDLLTEQDDGSVSVLLGLGDGTFKASVSYLAGVHLYQAVLGDWNGDGRPDVAVVDQCIDFNCANRQGSISVILGNGNGTLQAAPTYEMSGVSGENSIAAVDLNQDGRPDLVEVSQCSPSTCASGELSIRLRNADGSFQSPQSYSTGGLNPRSIAVADVNRDGRQDLIVANNQDPSASYGTVGVLLGNGDGTFGALQLYSSGGHNSDSVAVADMNGNGTPDLIVASSCSLSDCSSSVVSVLLGNGDGSYRQPQSYGSGGADAVSVFVDDVNGDGIPDVIVANHQGSSSTGSVGILLGNGDGTLQPAQIVNASGLPQSAVTGDLNGDGKPDLVIAEGATVRVLLGNGDGTFQPIQDYTANALNTLSVSIADVNGDGKPDLIVSNLCLPQSCALSTSFAVLLGNGDGTFQAAQLYAVPGFVLSAALADINTDGRMDVLLGTETTGNAGSHITVFNNVSTGPAATHATLAASLKSPSAFQPVTFTGVVTTTASGVATGSVQFTDNGALLGSAQLIGGQAQFTSTSLGAGQHFIVAYYSGDGNFAATNSYGIHLVVRQSTSSVSVMSAPNPSIYGQNVSFRATVTATYGVPQGSVTFSSGTSILGTVTLSGGTASLSTTLVNAGANTVTAAYGGSGDHVASSNTTSQSVSRATSTSKLTSSAAVSGFGQNVTLTANVTCQYAGAVTGTATFKDGAAVLGSMNLSNNTAIFYLAAPGTGKHTFSAIYSGDGNVIGSNSANVPLTVNKETTSTSVISSINPALLNGVITFTATVSGQYGGATTGSIAFKASTATIATVPLAGSQANMSTSFSTTGTRAVTAQYLGDGNNGGSTSKQVVQSVLQKYNTTVGVTASPNPAYVKQPVTFSASVTSPSGAIPDGEQVTFTDGTSVLGNANTASGVATYVAGLTAPGSHSIKAAYQGDSTFSKNTSAVFTQQIAGFLINQTWIPPGVVSGPYSVAFTSTSGSPVTWSFAAGGDLVGALGLALNPSTGVLSGTPTFPTNATAFTLQATATGGAPQAQQSYNLVVTAPSSTVQLPQNWVDQGQCDAARNNPDTTVFISNSPHPGFAVYACTSGPKGTPAIQTALNDAEGRRVSSGTSTKIIWDAGPRCAQQLTQPNAISLPNQGYSGTKCIVIDSSNPLRDKVQVGSVAISSCSRASGVVTCNTLDPHGLNAGDQFQLLGITGTAVDMNCYQESPCTAVTVSNTTQFTFSQAGPDESGTVIVPFTKLMGPQTLLQQANTNQNFYQIIETGQGQAISGAAGAHHYAWFDMDVSTAPGLQINGPLVVMGNDGATLATQGFHLGFNQFYFHHCAGSLVPTTIATFPQPIPCSTASGAKDGFRMLCGDCWAVNGMFDQIQQPGTDTHCVGSFGGQGPMKITNNHCRGGSTAVHFGGAPTTIPFLVPTDIEIRNNLIEIDPNWYGLDHCGHVVINFALLDRFEVLNGNRVLFAGNLVRYSWCNSGNGSMIQLTPQSYSGWEQVSNVTIEDNYWSHMYEWLPLVGRSPTSSGLSMPTQNILVRNNLVTDAANPNYGSNDAPESLASTPMAQMFSCVASRTGNVATLSSCSCSSKICKWTGVSPGDFAFVSACSDPTFNTSHSVSVISSNPFTFGPMTYPNPGPDTYSTASCTLDNHQGWPANVTIDHNTIIAANITGGRNVLVYVDTAQGNYGYGRNFTWKNTIFARIGGVPNVAYCGSANLNAEGSSSTNGIPLCLDQPTLAFHHLALFGPSGSPGSIYSEWNPPGTEINPPATLYIQPSAICQGSPGKTCAGFVGNMSSVADPAYHNYGLLSTSYYASGNSGQADDGKNLGVDINELDNAMVSGAYICRSACGTVGPHSQ